MVGTTPRGFSEGSGIYSSHDGGQLKSRSGHPSPTLNLPPPGAGNSTTDMGSRKEPAAFRIHSVRDIVATAVQTTFAQWTSIILMISLIFGGCCANVYALEAIIKNQPSSGI
ncbi:hypothetical protein BDV18DRAFT_63582 [Aspergillus unguis]